MNPSCKPGGIFLLFFLTTPGNVYQKIVVTLKNYLFTVTKT